MRKRIWRTASLLLALPLLLPLSASAAIAPDTTGIGEWDGSVPSAQLERPYEDPSQQNVEFGMASYYRSGWRAYMDTRPADYFLNSLGMGINGVFKEHIEPVAQMMEEVGIKSARIELGWGYAQYDDETRFGIPAKEKEFILTLQTLQKHGIRPLVVLNANSAGPVPLTIVSTKLVQAAAEGSTTLKLDPKLLDGIVPGYTGLQGQAYQTGFPLITKLDTKTGNAQLSAPLAKELPAGELRLAKLKYRPFSPLTFANGESNPSGQETLDGWKKYVQNVSAFVRKSLGTDGAPDAGFDVEVWNELTFGSQFLNIDNYYSPPLNFGTDRKFTYKAKTGEDMVGIDAILALTVDTISDPANRTPGVKIINGFSNQTPWANHSSLYPGQTGFSRHPYASWSESSMNGPGMTPDYFPDRRLNALGEKKDNFLPNLITAHPEFFQTFVRTESLSRDLAPFPTLFKDHFRYSNPEGKYGEFWLTENNFITSYFTNELAKAKEIGSNDPAIADWRHHIAAKSTLRNYLFHNHKGIDRQFLYNFKETDSTFAFVPNKFFHVLKANGFQLTDAVRAEAGPQWNALKNVVNLMKQSEPVENPRKLTVSRLIEYMPRLVFKGDGTVEHPDMYHRDDFVLLPYQLSQRKFAIPYYVMTRDMTKQWDLSKDSLDPSAYDMPEQDFAVTLQNINTDNPKISVYDPIRDSSVPVIFKADKPGELTLMLRTTDYPRFLIIEESSDGPAISNFALKKTPKGGTVSFIPNFTGEVEMTWGPYPVRESSQFKREFWTDDQPGRLNNRYYAGEDTIDIIDFFSRGGLFPFTSPKGSTRITGTITPKYTEPYTFYLSSNTNRMKLKVNGKEFSSTNYEFETKIDLQAGESYDFIFEYYTPYESSGKATVYWMSEHQPKQPVTSSDSVSGKNRTVLKVTKDLPVTYEIEGLKDGEGVKLFYQHGATSNRFPMWNYDYQGALPPYYREPPAGSE